MASGLHPRRLLLPPPSWAGKRTSALLMARYAIKEQPLTVTSHLPTIPHQQRAVPLPRPPGRLVERVEVARALHS